MRPNVTRRRLTAAALGLGLFGHELLRLRATRAEAADMLIDDFSDQELISRLGTQWRGVSDQVMGGISRASIRHDVLDGRPCLRLTGDVRLENNGGFLQAGLDLAADSGTFDASSCTGIRLEVRGNAEQYSVHLRTPDNTRPWQSYRAHFTAGARWRTIDLPFTTFTPYRLDTPLDAARLLRIGLVAIGRAFSADLAIARLSLYGDA